MPSFQNASNISFVGGTSMVEVKGDHHDNQMTLTRNGNVVYYAPYQNPNPWTISIQQNQYSQNIPNIEEIPNPNASDWVPGAQSTQPHPPRPSTPGSAVKPDEEQGKSEEKPRISRSKILLFLTTILRQIYLHLLLRLPSLYFSRVEQIFQDAKLSYKDIKDLSLRSIVSEDKELLAQITASMESSSGASFPDLPPSYKKMKERWENFIDSLLEEWRTLNIVSALVVPGVLTMFQIPGAASSDPVSRYLALWSLLSALASLLYGCMYIIQFSRMRKTYNLLEWSLEMQTRRWIFWDVVIMLSMPVLWLTWSIITFIVCIVWFMWRASTLQTSTNTTFPVSRSTEFGFRIFICVVLGIATIYGILILATFRRYGSSMRAKWENRAQEFLNTFKFPPPNTANDFPVPEVRGYGSSSRIDLPAPHEFSWYRPAPIVVPAPPMMSPPRRTPTIIQDYSPGYWEEYNPPSPPRAPRRPTWRGDRSRGSSSHSASRSRSPSPTAQHPSSHGSVAS